jgi:sterol desaturase/sphingolipid hydroxylase (fatty acid hydroxylase superfamily)
MHGIHHSIVPQETNSNWSTTFSVWDRLHRTLQLNIPQHEITIGVPAYQNPADVTLPKVLAMPFTEQRDDWKLPDGTEPTRLEREIDPTRLLA